METRPPGNRSPWRITSPGTASSSTRSAPPASTTPTPTRPWPERYLSRAATRTVAKTFNPRGARQKPYESMEGGPGDELLCVTVERPVLDQLPIVVGGTLEYRVDPGLTGDDREDRHLHEVDQARSHQRPIHRQAAVRAQRHVGLLLEPGDDVDCAAADVLRVRPVEWLLQHGRHHRRRRVPHPRDLGVAHVVLLG